MISGSLIIDTKQLIISNISRYYRTQDKDTKVSVSKSQKVFEIVSKFDDYNLIY